MKRLGLFVFLCAGCTAVSQPKAADRQEDPDPEARTRARSELEGRAIELARAHLHDPERKCRAKVSMVLRTESDGRQIPVGSDENLWHVTCDDVPPGTYLLVDLERRYVTENEIQLVSGDNPLE